MSSRRRNAAFQTSGREAKRSSCHGRFDSYRRYAEILLAAGVCLTIAACSIPRLGRNSTTLGLPPDPSAAGPNTITGMLIVVEPQQDCSDAGNCAPKYTIYNEDFSTRTALLGDVDDQHAGLLLAVTGEKTEIEVLSTTGEKRAMPAVRIADYRTLTSLPYQTFLVEQADAFSREKFGCRSLWDRSFAWHVEQDEAYLGVRMTDPSSDTPKYVEAWFDGNEGTLVDSRLEPENADPCVR